MNGKDLGTLVEHEGAVTCLDMFMPAAAPRPTHLFSGGFDGLINIWRVKVPLYLFLSLKHRLLRFS